MSETAVNIAFFAALALFSGFILGDELIATELAYTAEHAHFIILSAEILSLLAIKLLPSE